MARYRIPKDEFILEAVSKVTDRRKVVNSQRELKRLTEKEMSKEEDFRVSGPRLRLLAIHSNLVSIQMECRESEEKKALVKCPVCSTRLKKVRNMTVFGGTVTLGYRCPSCPYWSGLRKRIPTRYIFIRR